MCVVGFLCVSVSWRNAGYFSSLSLWNLCLLPVVARRNCEMSAIKLNVTVNELGAVQEERGNRSASRS